MRTGLDRYSYLWKNERKEVLQQFLTYSRQLGPGELEVEETPPNLKDFQREVSHTCPDLSGKGCRAVRTAGDQVICAVSARCGFMFVFL